MLVVLGCKLRKSEESELSYAVVYAGKDNTAFTGKFLAVVVRVGCRTEHETAAIDPYEDRQLLVSLLCWAPHVEIQAILAVFGRRSTLDRSWSVFLCLKSLCPMLHRLWSLPSKFAYRRRSEWNAFVNHKSVGLIALYRTSLGCHVSSERTLCRCSQAK